MIALTPVEIARVAAHCRAKHVTAKLPILKHARQVLGRDRLPSDTPDAVREEIERQKAVAETRTGVPAPIDEPVVQRWPSIKLARALAVITPVIIESGHYHTSQAKGSYGAQHTLTITWGEPDASGKTVHGGSQKYGRSGWHRTHVNWHSTTTLPRDWYTRVRPLGMLYTDQLVLDGFNSEFNFEWAFAPGADQTPIAAPEDGGLSFSDLFERLRELSRMTQ